MVFTSYGKWQAEILFIKPDQLAGYSKRDLFAG
jgi:hypothetical protein